MSEANVHLVVLVCALLGVMTINVTAAALKVPLNAAALADTVSIVGTIATWAVTRPRP